MVGGVFSATVRRTTRKRTSPASTTPTAGGSTVGLMAVGPTAWGGTVPASTRWRCPWCVRTRSRTIAPKKEEVQEEARAGARAAVAVAAGPAPLAPAVATGSRRCTAKRRRARSHSRGLALLALQRIRRFIRTTTRGLRAAVPTVTPANTTTTATTRAPATAAAACTAGAQTSGAVGAGTRKETRGRHCNCRWSAVHGQRRARRLVVLAAAASDLGACRARKPRSPLLGGARGLAAMVTAAATVAAAAVMLTVLPRRKVGCRACPAPPRRSSAPPRGPFQRIYSPQQPPRRRPIRKGPSNPAATMALWLLQAMTALAATALRENHARGAAVRGGGGRRSSRGAPRPQAPTRTPARKLPGPGPGPGPGQRSFPRAGRWWWARPPGPPAIAARKKQAAPRRGATTTGRFPCDSTWTTVPMLTPHLRR